jgi:hypothetical protein
LLAAEAGFTGTLPFLPEPVEIITVAKATPASIGVG